MTRSRTEVGFRRWMAELFDQEMWCLGRDIKRTEGNILLDLGMCRHRTSGEGSSMYTATLRSGASLWLWGFGAMCSEAGLGGVFVQRYDFAPKLTSIESALGVSRPEHLGPLIKPNRAAEITRVRHLLPQLVGWFANYEHWVAEKIGSDYRRSCLNSRTKPNVVSADKIAEEWDRAEKKCKRFRQSAPTAIGPWAAVLARLHPIASSPSAPTIRPPTRVTR
jgi:hypothetical protein